MEEYYPQTAMEREAGREHVMESQVLLSPAILWGILISDCHQSQRNETNEADDGWLITAGREAGTDGDVGETESDGYEESTAEPGTRSDVLWGSLLAEIPGQATSNDRFQSEAKALDEEATTKLWAAAGYNVEQTKEGSGAASAMRDATLNHNDGESTKTYNPPSGPYNIKKADGKGQGVYASQDIPRGTRILVDKPFFAVTKPYKHSTVIKTFDQMSFTRRKLYMQFSCPDRPDDKQMSDVSRIFEANCFNIDYSAAIFQTATRFNHSCLPNTYYSWSEARQELVFHAMIDVKEEEELTIAYGRPFLSHRERRNELRNYNFTCNCPACQLDTPFGQASESRRLVMKALDEQIVLRQTALNEGLHTNGLPDPLSLTQKLVELVKEEGLWGELIVPYRGAAELLKVRGDWEGALVFAYKQLEEERTCMGEESEVVGKTREYIDALEKVTGKREPPLREAEDSDKTEMDDLDVLDTETTEHDLVPKRPEQYLRTKSSPSPSPSPQSSSSSPTPLLHLPPSNKVHSQNTTPVHHKHVDPEPPSRHSSKDEAHANHLLSEEHKDAAPR